MKLKALLILLIFFPLVGCDRYTKDQAVNLLKGQEPLSFLNGFFSLTYHENTGGMLSLGADLSDELRVVLFTVLVGLVLIGGLIYILIKPMDKYSFTVGLLKQAYLMWLMLQSWPDYLDFYFSPASGGSD